MGQGIFHLTAGEHEIIFLYLLRYYVVTVHVSHLYFSNCFQNVCYLHHEKESFSRVQSEFLCIHAKSLQSLMDRAGECTHRFPLTLTSVSHHQGEATLDTSSLFSRLTSVSSIMELRCWF